MTFQPNGAPGPVNDSGSDIIVLQKRGGRWQAMSDIDNSENPLPQ